MKCNFISLAPLIYNIKFSPLINYDNIDCIVQHWEENWQISVLILSAKFLKSLITKQLIEQLILIYLPLTLDNWVIINSIVTWQNLSTFIFLNYLLVRYWIFLVKLVKETSVIYFHSKKTTSIYCWTEKFQTFGININLTKKIKNYA